jgi:hypothetical protein
MLLTMYQYVGYRVPEHPNMHSLNVNYVFGLLQSFVMCDAADVSEIHTGSIIYVYFIYIYMYTDLKERGIRGCQQEDKTRWQTC